MARPLGLEYAGALSHVTAGGERIIRQRISGGAVRGAYWSPRTFPWERRRLAGNGTTAGCRPMCRRPHSGAKPTFDRFSARGAGAGKMPAVPGAFR